MNNNSAIHNLTMTAGSILYAALLGQVITHDPGAGLLCALLPFSGWLVLRRPKTILFLLLFFLPFQSIPLFSQNIGGVTGVKPANLIAASALLVLFM